MHDVYLEKRVWSLSLKEFKCKRSISSGSRSVEEVGDDFGVPISLGWLEDLNPVGVFPTAKEASEEGNEVDDSHAPHVDEVPEEPQLVEAKALSNESSGL